MTGYTADDFAKGDRVELSPATDLWMRGVRYGTVDYVKAGYIYVSLDKLKSGRYRFEPQYLSFVD